MTTYLCAISRVPVPDLQGDYHEFYIHGSVHHSMTQ
jgi:hypothetical protein